MIAFAGIRPQVMGLADGTDGLCLSDLQDLVLDGQNIKFSKMPARVVVRPNLSKTRNKYFTFLTEEGCKYVLGYLQQRLAKEEILKPESPLITTDFGYRLKGWRKIGSSNNRFLVTNAITQSIRQIIRSVIKIRPYALRSYFDSQLLIAESHGCMTHSYRQFFMGHKGDTESRYTTNKGRLTEQMTEDMRRSFAQSQMFLSTNMEDHTEDSRKNMLIDMWRQQASMYGIDPNSLLQNDVDESSSHGVKSSKDVDVNVSTGSEVPKNGITDEKAESSPYETQIVDGEKTLLSYAAQGWDLVKDLPDARFLIRRRIPT